MKYRWVLETPQPSLIESLVENCGIAPLLAQCLVNRGVKDPSAVRPFLDPRLGNMRDPFQLPNMQSAIERICENLKTKQPIVIFGDYDVDGITATVILYEVLQELGGQVSHYLPHRINEGYGLSREAVDNCLKQSPTQLLLAVDCGSTANDTIAHLRDRGVSVIVIDHHQVANPRPATLALINPYLLPEDDQTHKELCSAGLAFKFAHALVKHGRLTGIPAAESIDIRKWLDLVALATIADLAPLQFENRILVTAGLKRLSNSERLGLKALKEVANIAGPIGVHEAAFQLAPRLNAAGRLDNATTSLDLLITNNAREAKTLAENLDTWNRERQKIERSIVEEVVGGIRSEFNPDEDFAIVVGKLLWHVGVIGIVASRIVNEFYRPAIILGGEGDTWRGSGRSIAGFDLAQALHQCDDLLLQHGGHAMAAGISIKPENVPLLRERLNQIVRHAMSPSQLQPELHLDAEVSFADMTLDALESLNRIGPFGANNPTLQFLTRDVSFKRKPIRIGKEQKHLKLFVTDGKLSHEALWWNAGAAALPEGNFDLAFTPQINEFKGRRQVQLKWLDWRCSS
jgi:single-stranded-DNA-specific exonuclease